MRKESYFEHIEMDEDNVSVMSSETLRRRSKKVLLEEEEEEDEKPSDNESVKTAYSSKSKPMPKTCPKQRTCCGAFLCICKSLFILTILIVLALPLIGFLLTKLEFHCEVDELSSALYSNIYGQDDAIKRTLGAVENFCGPSENRPLTLVFWGPTGVGKTLFASVFTHHFDANGQIVPSEHFSVSKYKDWFGSRIQSKPLVYTIDDIVSLEEMKSISQNAEIFSFPVVLVLTTSLESNLLNDTFLSWSKNNNQVEGFEYSGALPNWLHELESLNPFLVPFLPLSKTTIKLCIEKALNRLKLKYGKDDVEKIAAEYEYFHNGKRLFSKIGCKRVNDKILSVLTP